MKRENKKVVVKTFTFSEEETRNLVDDAYQAGAEAVLAKLKPFLANFDPISNIADFNKPSLTLAEAAKYIGRSGSWLYKRNVAGESPGEKIGRPWMYKKTDLDLWKLNGLKNWRSIHIEKTLREKENTGLRKVGS